MYQTQDLWLLSHVLHSLAPNNCLWIPVCFSWQGNTSKRSPILEKHFFNLIPIRDDLIPIKRRSQCRKIRDLHPLKMYPHTFIKFTVYTDQGLCTRSRTLGEELSLFSRLERPSLAPFKVKWFTFRDNNYTSFNIASFSNKNRLLMVNFAAVPAANSFPLWFLVHCHKTELTREVYASNKDISITYILQSASHRRDKNGRTTLMCT